MRKTKSQIRAEKIAALVAEQDAYDNNVKEAIKLASFARCDAVEQLYELLAVKPEPSIAREGKNGRYEVAADKDEAKRGARLIEAVSALLSDKDEQKSQPVGVHDGRAADALQRQRQAAAEQRSVSAASGHTASYVPTS